MIPHQRRSLGAVGGSTRTRLLRCNPIMLLAGDDDPHPPTLLANNVTSAINACEGAADLSLSLLKGVW